MTLKAISVKIRIVSIILQCVKYFICIYSLLSLEKGMDCVALYMCTCTNVCTCLLDSDKRPDPGYIRIGPPNHRACCKRQLK